MNKIILKYELDLNFLLIAINSPLKDYRLCFYINRTTSLNLKKDEDHEVWQSTNSFRYFSKYSDISSSEETETYLIANKGLNGGFLVPEMKVVDYFILIKSFIDEEDLKTLLDGLNKIDDVVVASEIDIDKLKSKENLVF